MLHSAIHVLQFTRRQLYNAVKDLPPEQWFAMPPGFVNNIAWNVGHIMVAQQVLVYERGGLPPYTSPEMHAMYRPGTSPADWTVQPNPIDLREMLLDLAQKMAADYETGKFDGAIYEELKTNTGLHLRNLEDTLSYNNYHEGYHRGTILALIDVITSG